MRRTTEKFLGVVPSQAVNALDCLQLPKWAGSKTSNLGRNRANFSRRIGKYSFQNIQMIILEIFFSATAVIFASTSAAAQSTSAPQLSDHDRPSFCQGSKLTDNQFLQSIEAIIAHGDLTDLPFITQTLHARFDMSYGTEGRGGQSPQKLIYQSDQMLGVPIQVRITININAHPKGYPVAVISFNGIPMTGSYPTFIADCLHMSAQDFSPFFGNRAFLTGVVPGYVPLPGEPDVPPRIGFANTDLKNPGKDGSHFSITIGYNVKLLVGLIAIGQR